MFDILAAIDPGWFAVAGLVGGSTILKVAEKVVSKPKKQITKPDPLVERDNAECPMFVTHVFERRLHESGVIKVGEMSTCDDGSCNECKPIRIAKNTLMNTFPGCGHLSRNHEVCQVCRRNRDGTVEPRKLSMVPDDYSEAMRARDSLAHKNREAAKYGKHPTCTLCGTMVAYDGICENCYAESNQGKKSFVRGVGFVARPPKVPHYANGRLSSDGERILWRWTDPTTGKSMGLKSIPLELVKKNFEYEIYSDQYLMPVTGFKSDHTISYYGQ